MNECVCVCVCVCVCTCMCMYTYMCVCVCMYVYMYVCICVCLCMYMCVFMHGVCKAVAPPGGWEADQDHLKTKSTPRCLKETPAVRRGYSRDASPICNMNNININIYDIK